MIGAAADVPLDRNFQVVDDGRLTKGRFNRGERGREDRTRCSAGCRIARRLGGAARAFKIARIARSVRAAPLLRLEHEGPICFDDKAEGYALTRDVPKSVTISQCLCRQTGDYRRSSHRSRESDLGGKEPRIEHVGNIVCWKERRRSKQFEAAENFADDFEFAERGFFTRMIRIVGNDLHARRPRRAQHLQSLRPR